MCQVAMYCWYGHDVITTVSFVKKIITKKKLQNKSFRVTRLDNISICLTGTRLTSK